MALGFAQHVGLGSSRLVSLFVLGYLSCNNELGSPLRFLSDFSRARVAIRQRRFSFGHAGQCRNTIGIGLLNKMRRAKNLFLFSLR